MRSPNDHNSTKYIHICIVIYFVDKASTPGSTLPSNNSKLAPPPVEIWLILPSAPHCKAAVAVSKKKKKKTLPLVPHSHSLDSITRTYHHHQ